MFFSMAKLLVLTKKDICILNKLPKDFLKHPVNFLAFGLGSGCSPKAPGTLGSLVGLLIYVVLPIESILSSLVLVVLGFMLGVYLCGKAAETLGVHDHGGIVWDEFVGIWIALIALPVGWYWYLAAFGLFRLFDIWKPQPIRYLDQKVSGGLGIMLDDVLAGIYALTCVQILNVLSG